MTSIRLVDPFRCRMWSQHDRLEMYLSEETCRSEIESFARYGQLIPVLGRQLKLDAHHDVELIYGARRLFVARLLNVQLKVELRNMSDREAIVSMDIENRQRTDISPYERGVSYAQWLREGYFESQEDIARTLKISASQVSRLLQLARLPPVVVEAFPKAGDICEGWGQDLAEALKDSSRRQALLDAARAIGRVSSRPPARAVYGQLLSGASHGRKRPKQNVHDEVVKDSNRMPLFRVRYQAKTIALMLPLERVPTALLESIRQVVATLLEQSDVDAEDAVRPRALSRHREQRSSGEAAPAVAAESRSSGSARQAKSHALMAVT